MVSGACQLIISENYRTWPVVTIHSVTEKPTQLDCIFEIYRKEYHSQCLEENPQYHAILQLHLPQTNDRVKKKKKRHRKNLTSKNKRGNPLETEGKGAGTAITDTLHSHNVQLTSQEASLDVCVSKRSPNILARLKYC